MEHSLHQSAINLALHAVTLRENAGPMNATTDAIDPNRDALRPLRYVVRVPLLIVHLLVGLPITLLCLMPPLASITLGSGERIDHRMIRWWQGGLMRIFGFRLKRVGEPSDLIGALRFLCGPESDFITGQSLVVDGGNHML